MTPETFLEASLALLDSHWQGPRYGYDRDSTTDLMEHVLASSLAERLVDAALDQVHTKVRGQREAATVVQMLRGTGETSARVYNLPTAVRCAESYHAVQRQLRFRPGTPMLSIFVNDYEIDPHCGVTIQTARSKGKPRWRNDPYRGEGALPEVVVPAPDLTSPTRSKSEEQAVLAARRGEFCVSKLAGTVTEPAIVFDGRTTVLTNQHEPKYLVPPDKRYEHNWPSVLGFVGGENYRDWLHQEFGINGALPSTMHFVAVGDLAIQRLVTRLQDEVLPYMSDSTPAGVPQAKRLSHLLTLASDSIRLMHEPSTVYASRSLKEDAWASLAADLQETLQRRNIDIPPGMGTDDVPGWIGLCQKSGELSNLDLDAVARRALVEVRREHEAKPVTASELLEAIRGELDQSIHFADMLPD